MLWSNRSGCEIAAAVGANASQAVFGAIPAEGAFEGADHRVFRIRREVAVTAFAVRTQLEHTGRLPCGFVEPSEDQNPGCQLVRLLGIRGACDLHVEEPPEVGEEVGLAFE